MDVGPARPRAPRWWLAYTAAALCLILGIVVPCGGTLGLMRADSDAGPTFRPPGSIAVPVDRPGRMVVWVEDPDTAMVGPEVVVPSDAVCVVTGPDDKLVTSGKPMVETTNSTLTTERIGAFCFDAAAPGTYTVAVTGSFASTQSIVVTADRGDRDAYFGLGALALFLVGGLLVLAGLATLIVTIVKHAKHPGF